MTNTEKAIKLLTRIKADGFRDHKWRHLKIEENQIYICSWDVDPHNGDIDDYEEEFLNEINKDMISAMERDVIEILREEREKELNKELIKKFYESK